MSTYAKGFAWAEQALRSGGCAPEEVEALTSSDGFYPTEFERGARAALHQYEEKQQAEGDMA